MQLLAAQGCGIQPVTGGTDFRCPSADRTSVVRRFVRSATGRVEFGEGHFKKTHFASAIILLFQGTTRIRSGIAGFL
jgi:hypothetical protein